MKNYFRKDRTMKNQRDCRSSHIFQILNNIYTPILASSTTHLQLHQKSYLSFNSFTPHPNLTNNTSTPVLSSMALSLPYLICILLFLPLPNMAQPSKNITLGLSLMAGDPSSSWVSPSKDFAFGFQETEPGSFLLAIWFDQIPEKTIAWFANRDHPAPSGSKIELSSDGGLILTSPSGEEIWRAKLRNGSEVQKLAYAAMLDTGNFVLVSQASTTLWQSFDEPSDTLLPTQTLNPGQQLISRFREKNYSGGRFSFNLPKNGNLALFTTNFPLYNITNYYYVPFDNEALGHQVVFNRSGFLYLTTRNGTILTSIFFIQLIDEKQILYQRMILEYDGVLRHYVYPKASPHLSGWSIESFVPDNICTAVIQQTGGGVCGYNSYCELGYNGKPHCICPPGYTLFDPDNEMSGCFQNFLPQSCEKASQEKNQFDLQVLQNVDWPMSNYDHFHNVSIGWCREVCLEDCFCAVVIFRQSGDCWKKKLPLTNGMSYSVVNRTAFVKLRINGGPDGFRGRNYYEEPKRVWKALLATSGSANIILLGLVFIGLFFICKRGSKASANYNIRNFSHKELAEATNGFNEELGRGAFGVVYKGVFTDQTGSLKSIAVKRLEALSQNADKEFKAEVNSIGHTHHKNLVKLIGFCREGEHRMLVYEFMSHGTLFEFLYQLPKPAWQKRLRIAQGIARGLLYLHEDCSTQVIHCDIKPQNILLDDDHNARISDFGLAKLLRLDQTQTNTAPRGTRGYVAPEWFKNMPITTKVDVYSFGILLLEIICCQRNVQRENNEDEDVVLLTDRAFDCYQMETIHELLKDDKEALDDKKRLERMMKISIWCYQDDPNLRPAMRMVVEMLEGLVQVLEPPCPATYSTSNTS